MKQVLVVLMVVLMLAPGTGHAGKAFMGMPASGSVYGKAVEVLKGDGSTYVLVELEGKKTWVVVPEMAVTTGTLVSFAPGKETTDHVSAELNRKFEKIVVSPGPTEAPAAPVENVALTGKAVEVLDSGGYTYVNIESDGKKSWVAVPQMKVAVGENVSFRPGTEMNAFESKSLNRKFDKVVFSEGPVNPKPAPEAPKKGLPVSGKVVEVLDSGGYTYVNVENQGRTQWVAIPAMKVTKGSTVSFAPGDEMPGFTSKTLNRSFDSIIFSSGPVNGQQPGAKPGKPAGKTGAGEGKIAVEKATGADAYTVAEVHKLSAKLNKKKVTVRGKVVKVSSGIMNRNWIHLKDGSGSSKKDNDKLVVTSDVLPNEGDVITITGTLAKDRDFGSGYKYKVIVEKAQIVP